MAKSFNDYEERALKAMAGQIDEFYLVGGTALSLYYFRHRESFDLDFFTQKFDLLRVRRITDFLSQKLQKKVFMIRELARKNKVKIAVYIIKFDKRMELKLDFVEDYFPLLKRPKEINGIHVASLEDIYLRKICAVSGTAQEMGETGRPVTRGARQEAKDFYDLYFLSHTFMPLADFSFKYGSRLLREGLIRWFRSYDRIEIKTGLLDLKSKKDVDYGDMERHFKRGIDRILEKEISFL